MKSFNETDWQEREGRWWTNLFNTLSGVRSSVLIGTSDSEGRHNLAIFNSLVHIGANPPLLGFILRPTTVKRDTYDNIKETGFYTINHVRANMIDRAHQTSAKYDTAVSEFEATGLTPTYFNDSQIPAVEESPIRILMRFKEEHLVQNGTRLIVGEVAALSLNSDNIEDDGSLKVANEDLVATSGLYDYHKVDFLEKKGYAKP